MGAVGPHLHVVLQVEHQEVEDPEVGDAIAEVDEVDRPEAARGLQQQPDRIDEGELLLGLLVLLVARAVRICHETSSQEERRYRRAGVWSRG